MKKERSSSSLLPPLPCSRNVRILALRPLLLAAGPVARFMARGGVGASNCCHVEPGSLGKVARWCVGMDARELQFMQFSFKILRLLPVGVHGCLPCLKGSFDNRIRKALMVRPARKNSKISMLHENFFVYTRKDNLF